MARLKNIEIKDDDTITQTISMKGVERKLLSQVADENGRSLSAEIMYRVRQTLKAEQATA